VIRNSRLMCGTSPGVDVQAGSLPEANALRKGCCLSA
jgi:hypothetical protein